MGRTICIGDLHGEHDAAVKLMNKLGVTAADWVIFLGDFVDRGLESGKCCDLVRRREQIQGRIAGLLGNHEEKHLDYEDIVARLGRPPHEMPPTHVATRMQLTKEHYDWFRSLPLYIRIPEHNACAVHAGVFPGRTIEQQTPRHLLHIQMIRPYDFDHWGNMTINEKSLWSSRVPEAERDQWKFWHHFWDGPERIIFGHSVLNKPLVREKAVGIDGGACFGRELWAFVLDTNEIVSIKSNYDSDPNATDLQRRGNRGREVYPIDGDVGTY
jgi:hypothetical protein